MRGLGALLAVLVGSGCYLSHEREDPGPGFDAGRVDAGSGRTDGGRRDAGRPRDAGTDAPDAERICTSERAIPVDLLLVVDASGSMEEEQFHLAEQLPQLVRALVEPPDDDGDGRPDWNSIPDLHIGVITPEVHPLCGEDGVLRTAGTPEDDTCAATYPEFLSFPRPIRDAERLAHDAACVARVGARGCGVEQPLEAALKALSPRASGIDFVTGRGHGDRENAGFLRAGSLLAIVILTDEDDCSLSDPSVFEMEWDPGTLPPCGDDERDRLFPVDRYVDGLLALRGGRRDRVALALIAGVPEVLVEDPLAVDFEALLADGRMVKRLDRTATGPELVSACRGRLGEAIPARRLVELARELGGQSSVASICQERFAPLVGAVARLVGTRACAD